MESRQQKSLQLLVFPSIIVPLGQNRKLLYDASFSSGPWERKKSPFTDFTSNNGVFLRCLFFLFLKGLFVGKSAYVGSLLLTKKVCPSLIAERREKKRGGGERRTHLRNCETACSANEVFLLNFPQWETAVSEEP